MKRRNKLLAAVLAVLGVLLILFAAFSFRLASYVMTGDRQTLDEAFAWQSEHYDTSFYESLEKTDYVVNGFEDYALHVQYLENPTPTDKYVIISHGYTDNRMGALKYVPMYMELGFNCIVYDLRGHGENEPTFTTYGAREGSDLLCLVDDSRDRYKDIAVLGLHGESLGAATVVTSLKYSPRVDFVVADCGFSDIENVLREGYRAANVPSFLFDVADVACKLRYGWSLRDMRPIDSLGENTVPILFIHGEDDAFILPKNSQDMARQTKGYSELHLIPGAGHAESILISPEEYKGYVAAFLEKTLEK